MSTTQYPSVFCFGYLYAIPGTSTPHKSGPTDKTCLHWLTVMESGLYLYPDWFTHLRTPHILPIAIVGSIAETPDYGGNSSGRFELNMYTYINSSLVSIPWS